MTLLDALRQSRPPSGDVVSDHKPIRRSCWVAGHRIQWWVARSCWIFMNAFSRPPTDDGDRRVRVVDLLGQLAPPQVASQGLLTPDSMLATDWELA